MRVIDLKVKVNAPSIFAAEPVDSFRKRSWYRVFLQSVLTQVEGLQASHADTVSHVKLSQYFLSDQLGTIYKKHNPFSTLW